MKIILGSKSAGRRKMLEEMGIPFEAMAADIDEKAIRLKDPNELVLALARAKADALRLGILEPAILITADQVVTWNGIIREKPENEREAREFLRGYNTHPIAETVSAVVATNLATGKRAEAVDIARVHFNPFSENDIDDIIAQGETFHLAGGFSIGGEPWERHIQNIEGTRDSVLGLPKDITERLMQEVKE